MLLITTFILGAFLLLAIWRATPWHPFPVSMSVDSPTTDFTVAQIDAAHQLRTRLRWLSLTPWVLTLAVTLLLGFFGVRWFERILSERWPLLLQVAAVVFVISLATLAIRLPFAIATLRTTRAAGLSTTSWGTWLIDLAKNFAISLVLTSAALAAIVWAARTWTRWWIPTALAAALLTLVMTFLMPVVFEPIFNKFSPMPQGQLRESLLTLAERDGVAVSDVLVADASRRTNALNAYVSGFGATRRIVVYDTMLRDAPPSEVESVVAHELGHAKENDVLFGALMGAIASALGVLLLALALGSRVTQTQYVGAIVATFALLTVVQQPLSTLVTRQLEMRADVHALTLTKDPTTYAQMQKRLATSNRSDLMTPRWIYLYFGTHPTTMERISFARFFARENGLPVPPPMAGQ